MSDTSAVPEYRQKYVYLDYLQKLNSAKTAEERKTAIDAACVDDSVTAQMFISLCVYAYTL